MRLDAATRTAVGLMVAALMASCSSGEETISPTQGEPTNGPPPTSDLPLPASFWVPSASAMGAPAEGDLYADGSCVRLRRDGSTTSVTVLWPKGFGARRDGTEIEVVNANGEPVARTGTHVLFYGGFVDDAPMPDQCTKSADGNLFELNQDLDPLT